MAVQRVDDAFGILAAGQPRSEDDGVFDDDLVLPREVLDPAAQRLEPGLGRLVERDGAFAGSGAGLVDHPAHQQAAQFAAHMADRRRPVEVPDRQLGARLDLAGGELLVVGRQDPQDEVGGHGQAVGGAGVTHGAVYSWRVKYGSVKSSPTARNSTRTRIPIASCSGATPITLVSIW